MNSTFQHNLNLALIISALLHILLALNLTFYSHNPVENSNIEIEYSSENKIVSPSEAPEIPAPDATKLSERDSVVEREMIKRGTPGDAVQTGQQAAPRAATSTPRAKIVPPSPVKTETQNQRPAPNLKLDQSTLLNQFGKTPPKAVTDPMNEIANTPDSYQAFSRPPGSGAKFLGNGGSSDYLPSLPDGDLTLLNAKANQYAVFVRRVAVQVFAELRQVGWESLQANDIRAISADAVFEAVMAPDGELVSIKALEASGSRGFDEVLRIAVNKGTRDRNPPAGAKAEDGQIHFIFKARSWVALSTNPRNQASIERRWLLLATGLL